MSIRICIQTMLPWAIMTTVSTQLHSGSAPTTSDVTPESQELGTTQSSCREYRPHCLALCLLVSVRNKGDSQKCVKGEHHHPRALCASNPGPNKSEGGVFPEQKENKNGSCTL